MTCIIVVIIIVYTIYFAFALLVTYTTCHFQHFSTASSSFRVGRCTKPTDSAVGCIWISTSKWHKCVMFCYYGDISGAAHPVVGQRFPLPRLWAMQRLANYTRPLFLNCCVLLFLSARDEQTDGQTN